MNLPLFIILLLSAIACLPPSHASAETPKKTDAVLVLDSSGSMKKTDPLGLRKPASKLFIKLLGSDDSVGVVSFSREARPLIALTVAGDDRKKLSGAVDMVDSKGEHTDIYSGLKQGYDILAGSAVDNERIIILMSDGRMDSGDKDKDESLLSGLRDELVPEIKKAGIKTYTIAFTETSDRQLLEDIAIKTGGMSYIAKTDKELHQVFASIFEGIKSPDTLPIKAGLFSVDSEVNEMTLLVTKKGAGASVSIKDPSGKEHRPGRLQPGMQWFESRMFDMVTINRPQPGRWAIGFSSGEGDKVFIITDLKLLSSLRNGPVNQGVVLKLDAWLEKEGKVLTSREILEHMEISAHVTAPDGKEIDLPMNDEGKDGDPVLNDSIYTASLRVDRTGTYKVRLTAGGQTFNREKVYTLSAVESKKAEQPKPAAVPATALQVKPEKQDAFSWTAVIVRFLIINTAIAVFIASGILIRRTIKKSRGK